VVLSLVDKQGNPSAAQLYVRVTQDSILVVAGDAKEQAETSAKKLSHPLVSDVSGALTNISDTLSDQQKLVASFNALMKKFEPLIKIADQVAKVRFFYISSFIEWFEFTISSKDPSLCQFCVASAFCRTEGELTPLFWSFYSYASVRSDGGSATSSECGDSRSRQNNGGCLLVHGFR
jgi:hypothetical protein